MTSDVLIVDDEVDIRTIISDLLKDEGYGTRLASDGQSAVDAIIDRCPTLILLDIWLGNSRFDGMKVLDIVRRDHPEVPVIMMSGHGNIETAVAAIKKGAYDFIEKPFKTDRLLLLIARAIEAARLRQENNSLKLKTEDNSAFIGTSSFINTLKQTIEKIGPTNSRAIITGPPGSGKELIAYQIHAHSHRSKHSPFLVLNCATMDPNQFEEELFGVESQNVEKEAQGTGIIERAHLGTLLFDEIADMPLAIQGKFVRVLQEGAFKRIRGNRKVEVDVRVIATSSYNLSLAIQQGKLREDLFYRLNVVPIEIKSLRQRKEDIPFLASHFLMRSSKLTGQPVRSFSEDAIATLQAYDWPGNIRQLRNVIDWVLIMSEANPITSDVLPPEILSNLPAAPQLEGNHEILKLPLRKAREMFETQYLLSQVSRFSGNISRTANFIGMERSALHRKLRALGVVRGNSNNHAA